MHMTISIVVMKVTVSVAAMCVTVSSSNFIFLSLTDTHLGTFWISRKGRILEKRGGGGGGMTPLTNYV